MVAVLSDDSSGFAVVAPIHEHLAVRTGFDPIVDATFEGPIGEAELVVSIVCSLTIRAECLKPRVLGRIDDEGTSLVKELWREFLGILSLLVKYQALEHFDPEWEEDDDDITPITAGIFQLCPESFCVEEDLYELQDEMNSSLIYLI